MKKVIIFISILFPWVIKKNILRAVGYKIADEAKVKAFTLVFAEEVVLGPHCKIDNFVIIAGLKSLKMDAYSSIQRFSYISGSNRLLLNCRALVGSRCILNLNSGDISLGDYSALAPKGSIYTHGSFLPVTHGYSNKNQGVSIGKLTWVMHNTTISPGVNIGNNSIVLPGSVIVKDVPDMVVIYDSPVERKSFPIGLFKKNLKDEELVELIKRITISFLNSLIVNKIIDTFTIDQDKILAKSKKAEVTIFLKSPLEIENIDDPYKKDTFYFWYNINEHIMMDTNYFCFDFVKIIHSSKQIPLYFYDMLGFMFSEFGLKFIDQKYYDYNN